jgi:hypothetical protein
MKHIHTTFSPNNLSNAHYDVDIFQDAYDSICVSLKNMAYVNPGLAQFCIPVCKKSGFAIKINKTCVSNNNGCAADLIDFLDSSTGHAFISPMIQKIIFDNDKKRGTAWL